MNKGQCVRLLLGVAFVIYYCGSCSSIRSIIPTLEWSDIVNSEDATIIAYCQQTSWLVKGHHTHRTFVCEHVLPFYHKGLFKNVW